MFVIDDLAALLAAMGPEALAGATGATGAGGAASAGAMGAGAAGALSPEMLGMRMSEFAPPSSTMTGRAMPLTQPISETTITGQPSALGESPWKARMQGANEALRFASKFIPNKSAKNMLNLMAMTSGAAMNVDDPSKVMSQMEGPLTDISSNVQADAAKNKQRMSEMMKMAPSTAQQPAGGPVTPTAAPAAAGAAAMPPTRLMGDQPMPTREDLLRRMRGY